MRVFNWSEQQTIMRIREVAQNTLDLTATRYYPIDDIIGDILTEEQTMQLISEQEMMFYLIPNPTEKMRRLHEMKWKL